MNWHLELPDEALLVLNVADVNVLSRGTDSKHVGHHEAEIGNLEKFISFIISINTFKQCF